MKDDTHMSRTYTRIDHAVPPLGDTKGGKGLNKF